MHPQGSTPDAVQIPVRTRRGEIVAHVTVDSADAVWASKYRWHDAHGYACRSERIDGKSYHFLLHRELLGLTQGDGKDGDHIDRDRMNCRRDNLRVVTRGQNGQNRPSQSGARSRFRGVSWHGQSGKWRASMTVNYQRVSLGLFATEEEAAKVARDARLRQMGHAVD